MMKSITHNQYIELVTELSKRELISEENGVKTEKILHCLLGDVIARMDKDTVKMPRGAFSSVMTLWRYCGIDKSLQEISEDVMWAEGQRVWADGEKIDDNTYCNNDKANRLLLFLNDLFMN